ncbi:retrotransposon gag protein [Rhizoctonia solani 123E]|uniref:Retrotransposon gag protein n=1 Tax=Rhizoctonia solani 123E TaxID=1423351 RepID=A0A074RFM5_9AGAM|nr:retrotransposon gag protein [Rhizoctonia solani 123E]
MISQKDFIEILVFPDEPSTPQKGPTRPDVDPTPKPAQPRRTVRVVSRSRSPDIKPLHHSRSPSPTLGSFGLRTSYTPRTAQTTSPTTASGPRTPKVKEPDAFDGTRGKAAEDWLLQVAIWFRTVAPTFPDEESIVLHILGLTKGRAADWARPHTSRIMARKINRLSSFVEFGQEFTRHFQDPNAKQTAARKINELAQTADVESYITDFENLTAELEWNEEAYQAAFEKGLHWKVKELLSQVYPAPSTFEEIKTHARRIDATRRENEASRPKRDNIPKKATTVTATTKTVTTTKPPLTESANFVSPEEREKR